MFDTALYGLYGKLHMNSGIRKVKRARKEFGHAFQSDLNASTIILFDCMTRNISNSLYRME